MRIHSCLHPSVSLHTLCEGACMHFTLRLQIPEHTLHISPSCRDSQPQPLLPRSCCSAAVLGTECREHTLLLNFNFTLLSDNAPSFSLRYTMRGYCHVHTERLLPSCLTERQPPPPNMDLRVSQDSPPRPPTLRTTLPQLHQGS